MPPASKSSKKLTAKKTAAKKPPAKRAPAKRALPSKPPRESAKRVPKYVYKIVHIKETPFEAAYRRAKGGSPPKRVIRGGGNHCFSQEEMDEAHGIPPVIYPKELPANCRI